MVFKATFNKMGQILIQQYPRLYAECMKKAAKQIEGIAIDDFVPIVNSEGEKCFVPQSFEGSSYNYLVPIKKGGVALMLIDWRGFRQNVTHLGEFWEITSILWNEIKQEPNVVRERG